MAIGNAQNRAELAASRARIVAAADETRRRIERNLHDGAQQRLVTLGIGLRMVQDSVPEQLPEIELRIDGRFPQPMEVVAYYVVSETITNTAKHARASQVRVAVTQRNGVLELAVHDDGVGGAAPRPGSGLVGLRDRAEATGGVIEVSSPSNAGTTVLVRLPVHGG